MITTWQYIKELFAPTDIVAVYMRKPGEQIQQRIIPASTACALPFQRYLRYCNVQGADVWIGMNPLKADAQSRCKDNIASIRRIYLDIDRDGHNTLLRINTDSKEGRLPAPAYVLNTSPNKYQIIWNVQGFTQEIAEGTMRSLVRLYNGDPAAVDISRVLRLPGLHNKKYGQTFPIVALPYSRKVYSPAEFPEPTCTPVASPRHATRSHSSGGIDTSPSGKEFAYCCHEIYHAPAHDLEAVCSRLTDEIEQRARARKKNTSDYRGYAERTVTNARQKIAFAQRHIL